MSPMNLAFGVLLFVSGCEQAEKHNDRRVDSAPNGAIWERSNLHEGKAISLKSPNQGLKLDYHGNGVTITNKTGHTVQLDVTPPASILWRPDGGGAAINNGNGSGQMSDLIVVEDGPSIAVGIGDQLKAYFFKHTGCRIDPAAASVSAEGWSSDSATLWIRFESWDRQAMCNSDRVNFGQYDLKRRSVTAHLSLSEAMARFCKNPEFRQAYGPNCDRYEGKSR